jgi:hypothetical protein
MKNKILKTLIVFGLWSIPFAFINKTETITRKYLALGQFDNTESSYQMFQIADNIGYINSFVAVLGIASLIAIWKPVKKTVEA